MFNGSKIRRIQVRITMTDGSVHVGGIPGGVSNNLDSALNRETVFIEVLKEDGVSTYLGRAHMLSISPAEAPDEDRVAEAEKSDIAA